MDIWEYKLIDSHDARSGKLVELSKDSITAYLNELGKDGWEIIDVQFLTDKQIDFFSMAKRKI